MQAEQKTRVQTAHAVTNNAANGAANRQQELDEKSRAGQNSHQVLHNVERYALLGLTAVLVLFFWSWGKTGSVFMTGANWRVLLSNQAVVGLVALAALVPLVCNQFDVSVGAIMGVCCWAMAHGLERHWAIWAAILLALAIGAALGAINGILVAYVGMSSFVSTLATWTILTGLISLVSNNRIITQGIPASLTNFGSQNFLGVPRIVWVLVIVALVLWYALTNTVLGRFLYGIGANARAARLVGIRVERLVFLSFVASGTLAAVAAVVLLANSGTADPGVGPGYTLPALTACFLGATAIKPGTFNVWGTVVGLLLVGVSVNGLVLAGAAGWVEPVFNGSALMIALLISTLLAKRRGEVRA
jgi:ribose transport system permease protein